MATFMLKDQSGRNKFNLILEIDIDAILQNEELKDFYLKTFEILGLPVVAIMLSGESIQEMLSEHTIFCKRIEKIFDREAKRLEEEEKEIKTVH